ncbi:MAG TPA: integrase core domain-containing protein [Acidimicrobiia bacterium]|nr:integrase core domain-containing protein [Acidimicrobiia bacterium]
MTASRGLFAFPFGAKWVLAITIGHLVAFTLAPGALAQFPLALAFYLTCPGIILVDWLDVADTPSRIALCASTSLAVNILTVTLLLSADVYSPLAGLMAVATVSAVCAVMSAAAGRPSWTIGGPVLAFAGSQVALRLPVAGRVGPRSGGGAGQAVEPSVPSAVDGRDEIGADAGTEAERPGDRAAVEANRRWQVATMEWPPIDGRRVDIVSVVDESTRVCVASLAASARTETDHAWEAIMRGVARWGPPLEILSGRQPTFESELLIGLETIGATVDQHRAPAVALRFHQTLKRELVDRGEPASLAELQSEIDACVDFYNHERAHRGIGGETPAARFEGAHPVGGRDIAVSTSVVDWSGRVVIPGPNTIVVPPRHAGSLATAVREGDTVILFVDAKFLAELELEPGRRVHHLHAPRTIQ